jgi:hypothetical protein
MVLRVNIALVLSFVYQVMYLAQVLLEVITLKLNKIAVVICCIQVQKVGRDYLLSLQRMDELLVSDDVPHSTSDLVNLLPLHLHDVI